GGAGVRVLAERAQRGVQGHAGQLSAVEGVWGLAEPFFPQRLRPVPPPIQHQHHARVAPGAAHARAGAQRRDQHAAGQPQLGGRWRARDGGLLRLLGRRRLAPARHAAPGFSPGVGLGQPGPLGRAHAALRRRSSPGPRRPRPRSLPAQPGAARAGDSSRGLLQLLRGPAGGMGRPRAARLLRRAPPGRPAGPQRPPARQVLAHGAGARARGLRGGRAGRRA
ncbi:class-II glutamine amidotransferase, partial [Helicosporidium sp. ATCC 50920]